MMGIDPRDAAFLRTCPCLSVPRYSPLPPMEHGQRVLVARNGVFVQVSLPWLECTVRVAPLPKAPPLPYGELEESIRFTFGVIPVRLLQDFVERGRDGLPDEVAGGLIYSASSSQLRLQVYEANHAGPSGIEYRMPELAPDEHIAVDLHTHGRHAAGWSDIDDGDDLGTKVCGVFGQLHRSRPSAMFRLVINGFYKALANPWEGKVAGAGGVDDEHRWPTLASMGFTEVSEWNI